MSFVRTFALTIALSVGLLIGHQIADAACGHCTETVPESTVPKPGTELQVEDCNGGQWLCYLTVIVTPEHIKCTGFDQENWEEDCQDNQGQSITPYEIGQTCSTTYGECEPSGTPTFLTPFLNKFHGQCAAACENG